MWVTTLWHEQLGAAQWAVICLAALIGAVTDLRSRSIPNWLTIPVWFAGLAFALVQFGTMGLMDAILGSVVVALPYVLLFLFAEGGAGDAKMMGALGAWLGVINGLITLACVAMAGVFVAIAFAVYVQRQRATTQTTHGDLQSYDAEPQCTSSMTMPFGVPILLGVLVSAVGVILWKA